MQGEGKEEGKVCIVFDEWILLCNLIKDSMLMVFCLLFYISMKEGLYVNVCRYVLVYVWIV